MLEIVQALAASGAGQLTVGGVLLAVIAFLGKYILDITKAHAEELAGVQDRYKKELDDRSQGDDDAVTDARKERDDARKARDEAWAKAAELMTALDVERKARHEAEDAARARLLLQPGRHRTEGPE